MAQATNATRNNTIHRVVDIHPNESLYMGLWFGGWVIVILLSAVTFIAPLTLLFLLIFVERSFVKVKENEIGAAFAYGKALIELPSGLRFLPFGLMQSRRYPRGIQQFQCPGEPEKVFKKDDKDDLPEGMVRPIRVVTGGPRADKAFKDDLLDVRMTLTLSYAVQWSITNVLYYASYYGEKTEVEKQIRDIGEALLAEIAVTHSAASFLKALPEINEELGGTIEDHFRNSGVEIKSTRLISPDLSHSVSDALAGIPTANAEAKRAVIRAEANKTTRIKRGEGDAAAQLAVLNAQADGRKKMKTELEVTGDAVLASEAVRGILKETDVLIAGAEGGMKDVMGLVKGAQSALNSPKKGVQQ